ncbi:hypothetical protein IGI04_007992 [Brassica rapa subsp. trilocularis]|uniref:Uncharacterized protein n=1 Tax=Brassica rapa subsp. trilocularis TaxID=1813537 RepID=A0ABQ7NLN4_BRACM|nr:hypothetical protein IGI04_007992 [Brassica rapa subsp. trilocularis]
MIKQKSSFLSKIVLVHNSKVITYTVIDPLLRLNMHIHQNRFMGSAQKKTSKDHVQSANLEERIRFKMCKEI